MYAHGEDRTEVENKTLVDTLEDCVARCVRCGSNICAVMSFKTAQLIDAQSECLLYRSLGGWPSDLNDYFSTYKEQSEVLFLPPGCTRDPWFCHVDASSTLCPDPAVDGDCMDMKRRPLYAMESCSVYGRDKEDQDGEKAWQGASIQNSCNWPLGKLTSLLDLTAST